MIRMIEQIEVKIEVKNDQKRMLQALNDATIADNREVPKSIKIHQSVKENLIFSSSADVNKVLTIWTLKNTTTDFIFHLRNAKKVLKTVKKIKEEGKG